MTVPSHLDPTISRLQNKKEHALRRKKGTRILRTSSWALYYRSEFKERVSGITSLADSIEKIILATES